MHKPLGEFIRLHREQTKPQDVGLRADGRRRTPGLRREELAQLCDVSPTWLEQGRPVSASAKVLGRLADVMHLTAAERTYLFRLADKLDTSEANHDSPSANFAAIVKAIRTPAYILDRQWDAIAWNRPATDLFSGWLDQGKSAAPANLLRFMFGSSSARSLIADWPERAQRLVAEFRADCGKYADDEPYASLIAELRRDSEEFKTMWNAHHVLGRDGGSRRFRHPTQGALTFEQVTLNLAAAREVKLVMLLPA
ncbi:helix-turn-helix transcriptional regulator [Herminiimonas contaminans]|uniref:Helix-turn-helix domain-containing protein n=1 Tax=Herminiimonas contaminans TaxID=1111140 RepID=A0ABS0EYH2_9BURK|nr:helix-turn-helix transcriptional regulator [Herminiimonas contaminans]MBF8178228.1 helix-turn-helix domain-containing protein [Herminiimonas contaminans]